MRWLVGLLLAVAMTCPFAKVKAQQAPLATSWMIWDANTHRSISDQNIHDVRSIASVTKLMTAMVTIDSTNLNEQVEIKRYRGYSTHIPAGIKSLSRLELINLAMITSDNLAAHLLAMSYKDGFDAFVDLMNKKAQSLGMKDTKYVEATGLLAGNVSTAVDLNLQVSAALKYNAILEASKSSTNQIRVKKKLFSSRNTNPLVGSPRNILVSKTGWINASGGCLVMVVETAHGLRNIIILGSKSTRTRINDALFIMDKLDAPSPSFVDKILVPIDSIVYD